MATNNALNNSSAPFTVTSGNLTVTAGNAVLPNTNAAGTQGLLILGSTNFLSNLGTSNAFGGGAANLTFTTANAQNNTAFGNSCFTAVTTGDQNTAFGKGALNAMTTATLNVAIGTNALTAVGAGSGGNQNVAVGNRAGAAMTSGGNNVAIGSTALTAVTTGTNNVAIGQSAASAYTTSETNNICIGNAVTGTVGESNVTRIGTSTTACYVSGIQGVSVSNKSYVTIDTSTGQMGSDTGSLTLGNVGTTTATWSFATITLTSAQIKALHGTPIQFIAAPGSGKSILVMSPTYACLTYGASNVFTAGASQTINLYCGTAVSLYTVVTNAVIVQNKNTFQQGTPAGSGNTNLTNVSNAAVNCYNPIATEITGNAANNNTITISAWYSIISM